MAQQPKSEAPAGRALSEAADGDAAPIPVRAKVLGWYAGERMRPGREFTVPNEKALGSWMERLDGGPNRVPPPATVK